MKFKESALAHQYLDGLVGVEIGGAAHNPFGLDTINVDVTQPGSPHRAMYDKSQIDLCGEALPVDVVAPGNLLPFDNKSYDFVLASHVIEHLFDPLGALEEWSRVARKYLFIICPYPDSLPSDVGKPLTTPEDTLLRHEMHVRKSHPVHGDGWEPEDLGIDEHWSRWTPPLFKQMLNHAGLWDVVDIQDPDDKVGNGFTVVVDLDAKTVPHHH